MIDPTNTRRVRAWRRGIELRILTWCDGLTTVLVRPPTGEVESFHGTQAEVEAWIDARIPAKRTGNATRANRDAAAARRAAEMEAAR